MPNSHGSAGYDHITEEIKKVDSIISHQENRVSTKLENAKAEMGVVRQENQRLKMELQDIKKDYQSLQLRFFDIVKQDQDTKKSITDIKNNNSASLKHDQKAEESELVSLSLGRSPRSSSESKNAAVQDVRSKNTRDQDHDDHDHLDHDHDHDDLKANLTLRLGSEKTEVVTDPSLENSSENELKEIAAEADHESNGDHAAWQSSNKTLRNNGEEDHEVSNNEQPPTKRARVSVRARCDTPTMNDGCQWRKYGQKIAKGNPCPRAYYRCTVAPSCPVRKQVQRCAEDMSILITTYEGTHNHPLPVTATAMASTTSAAASMLLSGSSSSSDLTNVGFNTAGTTKNALTVLNGLNFGHFDTMRTKQFYSPNSSSTTTTTTTPSPLFPTITLDLTTSQIPSSASPSLSQFTRPPHSSSLARIPSSSLSFGNYSSEPNILPTLWGNGPYLGYGNTMLAHDKPQLGSLNPGRQSQDFLYRRCKEKMSNQANNNNPLHESLTETLTRAITSDPGAFKSVIAAAISSVVGGRGETKQDGMERLGQGFTFGEQNGNGLASSYFNGLSSSNF